MTLGICDTSEGKVEEMMNNVKCQEGGNTVTSDLIAEPDFFEMVESTIVVASGDPGIPSLCMEVLTAVYNSVQLYVYHFEVKAEECVYMVG